MPNPETLDFSFGDAETSFVDVIDKLTNVLTAIDESPVVKWIVPARYRAMLDELTKLLQGADKLLHAIP